MEELNKVIRKCIRGDVQAQNELYKQYRSKWYMLSMRYSKSKDEAQDILQEGLIQIFKDLKQFDGKKAQFSTWSSRVLVHAALKYLRKSSWQNAFVDLEEAQNYESKSVDIISTLSAKELIAMITKLPMGYRVVFNMYAIEGYTHKEIAQQLQISEGTSKSQLFKARKLLKKSIECELTSG